MCETKFFSLLPSRNKVSVSFDETRIRKWELMLLALISPLDFLE
jgi:hypothetical protein